MSKKKKYSEDELRKLGQGERLAKLRVDLGYKSRTSFSKSINYSASTLDAVEEFRRPISKNLIQAIDKKYLGQYDKEWLLTGKEKKILTIKNENPVFSEEGVLYSPCPKCVEKDKELKELNLKYNKLLEDYNECLKEVLSLKKASSK